MKTLYKFPLLDPETTEPFKAVDLNDGTGWSVTSYTLRGGLQEGVEVVEIDNGNLRFAVLPTRGMSIWKGQCGDIALGWDSPVKDPVNPGYINLQERGGLGWLKGFNEWIVRCGLNSMGAPCTDTVLDYSGNAFDVSLSLHGKIANIPARAVSIEITENSISIKGEVHETMMFGPALKLNTEIRTDFNSGALTLIDTVTNIGDNPAEHELLYHINYGQPLLEKGSRMVAPFKQVAPRDLGVTEGALPHDLYGAPEVGFVEKVYLYELTGKRGSRETLAMLRNAAGDKASLLRYSLKDFPCFTLWKNTAGLADGYVTGLEPSTNYPNSRKFEREKGRVLTLSGGESRTTTLVLETLDSKQSIKAAEAEVKKLQKNVKGTVHPEPLARLSEF